MTADTLPGKPIYNTDIPKFITNTVAKESHLNSTGFKLKQKWQGVKERKTALHQTDQQLERLQEKENKKKTEEDGLYGSKEASFRLRGETPVKTTATMMASKTPLKHFGSPALQTPSQQLQQQQQLDKSGKLLYNFTKRPSPPKDSPSVTAAATKSTRKALKVVERLKRGAVSDKTPLRMMGMEDKSKKISADTPSTRAVRRRNAVRNQMEKIEDAQSDSEDDRYVDISSSEGDSEQSENDNENESPAKRRAIDIDIEEEEDDSDKDEQLDRDQPMKNYFNAYKGKTSDTTLTELNDILTYQEFMKLLPQTLTSSLGTTATNDNGKNTLLNHYRMSFDEWFIQLKAGFNLAFYGFGSKKALLDQFAKQWLQTDGHLITLNGFSPVLNYRQLLLSLHELIVSSMYSSSSGSSRSKSSRRHAESPTGQIPQITSALLKELQKYHNRQRKLVDDDDDHNLRDIYLVVHNIDGPLLRNEKIQSSLSELSEYIHLIVSLDHTQSSFLWDAYQFHNFHFLFHDLTTYKPYTEESLSDEGVLSLYGKFFGSSSIRRGGQATSTVTGAVFVLNSLTQNAKQVFKVLSRLQLRDSDEEGISLEQLLTKCKEAFVCQTLQNLKMHLREFQDHQLVHERISDDGVVYLLIPFKQNQLKEILECCGLSSSSSAAAAAAAEGDEGDETDQE